MSPNLTWSILLALVGICGLWLAGSGKWHGWAVGLVAQLAWIVYALLTGQYGFILSAVGYGVVYSRGLWKMRANRAVDIPTPLSSEG